MAKIPARKFKVKKFKSMVQNLRNLRANGNFKRKISGRSKK